jgi:hypothetical protein
MSGKNTAVVALVSRFVDWFWLRAAEREARASGGVVSPRALELTGRAALAREAAARTERPPEPFAQTGSEAVAAELYRESIHWSLLAHAALGRAREEGEQETNAVEAAPPLASLLEATDTALLTRAAGGEKELAELTRALGGSYAEYAELDANAQRRVVERLERAAAALFEPLGTVQRRLERIWVRRVLHVLGVLVFAGAAVFSVRQISAAHRRSHDLAERATWTTSSRYPQGGCESPKQSCPGGENYFFHTGQENDPWIIFDLGKTRHVSGIEIDNRLDCCPERAVPLAVAVSTDKKNWKEVARNTSEFTTWRESFDSERARYVKIHIPSPSAILHLSRVRIYP